MVDRMCGSALRSDGPSKQPLAIVQLISSGDPLVRLPAPPNETVLRVGPLQLDLLDRTAKRGDRQIDLRPREFWLLKYMMQRSDELLTRATLLKEVWHYKFVPEHTFFWPVRNGPGDPAPVGNPSIGGVTNANFGVGGRRPLPEDRRNFAAGPGLTNDDRSPSATASALKRARHPRVRFQTDAY